MSSNAVYSVRLKGVLKSQELLDSILPPGSDLSTVAHCQDFEDNAPTNQAYTEVLFECETPPMKLNHVLVEADDDDWVKEHLRNHPYSAIGDGGWYYTGDIEGTVN